MRLISFILILMFSFSCYALEIVTGEENEEGVTLLGEEGIVILNEEFRQHNEGIKDNVSDITDNSTDIATNAADIVTNAAAIAAAALSTAIVGDFLIAGPDPTEYSQVGATPTKQVEWTAQRAGAVRIKAENKSSSGDYAYSRIYVNGAAVGTIKQTADTSYAAVSYDDVTGLAKGDTVELWLWQASAPQTSYVQNVAFYTGSPIF